MPLPQELPWASTTTEARIDCLGHRYHVVRIDGIRHSDGSEWILGMIRIRIDDHGMKSSEISGSILYHCGLQILSRALATAGGHLRQPVGRQAALATVPDYARERTCRVLKGFASRAGTRGDVFRALERSLRDVAWQDGATVFDLAKGA